MNDLISIIVPVYKAELYIRKCLDSICAQTYTNWECILVDDGSPDNSGRICDEYVEKDGRFKVIHQMNGGPSSSRNSGIANSFGQWIVFVDADDEIGKDYIEQLYINRCVNGVSVAGFFEIVDNQVSLSVDFGQGEFSTKSGTFYQIAKNTLLYSHPSPIAKIFDGNLIRNNKIKFPVNISICEDLIFWMEYILYAEEIRIISPVPYYYLKDNSFLTKKTHSFDECFELANEFYKLSKILATKHNQAMCVEAKQNTGVLVMNALYALYDKDLSMKARIASLKRVKSDFKEIISNYYVPPTVLLKISKWLFLINVVLFDMFNIAKKGKM